MKYLMVILLWFTLSKTSAQGQNCYWQQQVEYIMDIDMDVKTHQFTGTQQLSYTNNSPDTLYRVFYHLYFNAFQPGSMMDVRSRTIADPDSRVMDRISKLSPQEIGYHQILTLTQDGQEVHYQVEGTVLEVTLAQPVIPNSSTRLNMEFKSQVPLQIRRTGRDNKEGISYSMAQWYPKMAEYDHMGWHADPYVGREFHGIWGDFEVKLHIDKHYTVAASGYLQNPMETGHGYAEKAKPKVKNNKITWHFKAPNVHDFLWAADTDYQHVIHQVPDGPMLHFFYQSDSATKHWDVLPVYTAKAYQYMNEHFGKYPYDQYSVIQGGDGGMEYPMATLITGHRSLRSLVGVTVHELIHSWYQMVLANNESLYAWMDEGFTDFVSAEVMDFLFEEKTLPHPQINHYNAYYNLVKSGIEEPMSTHSDHYKYNQAYGTASYSKGAVFLRQLSYIIGEEHFRKGMLDYYNQWKFKHPVPNDFKRVMEKVSGLELDWYLEYWINSTKTIDYAIKSVTSESDSTYITLERFGEMIMPIDLAVKFKDDRGVFYHIPLGIMRGEKPQEIARIPWNIAPDWPWTNPTYVLAIPGGPEQIDYLEIDPSKRMADIDFDNNLIKMEEYLKRKNP